MTNYATALLLILCWTHCSGQVLTDSIKVKRSEFLTVLVNLSEKKAEVNSLQAENEDLKLIIKAQEVVINDYTDIITNHEEITNGLENAVQVVKEAYTDSVKQQKKKWLKGFVIGLASGVVVGGVLSVVILSQ